MVRSVRSAVAVVLLSFAVDHGQCRDWRWIKPTIESEVRSLSEADADVLLTHFCEGKLHLVPKVGLTCSTRPQLGASFADITDNSFHPEGVIYGHFLGPMSEDAAVSGWSAETHPALWGGTLLLTRRDGVWRPVWYKSSAITRSCRKLRTATGKEILLCEEEDSGMGAQVHYLFALDLDRPSDIRDVLLTTAHSFTDGCTVRRQIIRRVTWLQEERRVTVELATPEWRYVSSPACAGAWLKREKRPAATSILTFELHEGTFHPVPLHQRESTDRSPYPTPRHRFPN